MKSSAVDEWAIVLGLNEIGCEEMMCSIGAGFEEQ